MTRPSLALLLSLATVALSGCPSPDPSPVSPCGAFPCGRDAGGPVFPTADAGAPDFCSGGLGLPCNTACTQPGYQCFPERSTRATVTHEGGSELLDVVAFPGGMCSRGCDTDEDCGFCGRCVDYTRVGRAKIRGLLGGGGVCRPSCELSCPTGTACDDETGACLEACTGDEQCRFFSTDTDGDGRDDQLGYDAEGVWFCVAGSCRDTDTPPLGSTCFDDSYCEAGYVCLGWVDGSRPGRCSRVGCSPGTCGGGAECITDDLGRSICALACVVGDEAPDQRVGFSGRGAGCSDAFACYPRSDDPMSREGVCLPGNYNNGSVPVGEVCFGNTDCFSPYGRATCIRRDPFSGTGVCAVNDCVPGGDGLWPGIEVPEPPSICTTSDTISCVHVGLDDTGPTLCAHTCETAETCPTTWGCVAYQSISICAPTCTRSSECSEGETCFSASLGRECATGDFDCTCR